MQFRNILRTAIIVVFAIFIIACTEPNAGMSAGSVTLHFVDGDAKLIGYDGAGAIGNSKEINAYQVRVEKVSDGTVVDSEVLMAPRNSWTVEGLEAGESYIFAVTGSIAMIDGSYVQVASGSVTRTISSDCEDIVVTLATLDTGEATELNVTVVRPEESTGAVSISAVMKKLDGTEGLTFTGSIPDGSETVVISAVSDSYDLASGLYTLWVTATDMAGSIWETTEAVRLFPDIPASGSVSFIETDSSDSEIIISDNLGAPIRFIKSDGTLLDGTEVTGDFGKAISIDLSEYDAASSSERPITMAIYVNGQKQTVGEDYTVAGDVYTLSSTDFIEGKNVVTFRASDGTVLGVGTADIHVILDAGYQVGDTVVLDGIECVIVYKAETEQEWGQYLCVDKNHDLCWYMNGSDHLNSSDYLNPGFGYEWGEYRLNGVSTVTGVTDQGIGQGLSNTNRLSSLTFVFTPSFGLLWDQVDNFRNTYGNEWFVPSLDELSCVYQQIGNLENISTTTYTGYWTSTDYSVTSAYVVSMTDGAVLTIFPKDDMNHFTRTRLCRYAAESELNSEAVSIPDIVVSGSGTFLSELSIYIPDESSLPDGISLSLTMK